MSVNKFLDVLLSVLLLRKYFGKWKSSSSELPSFIIPSGKHEKMNACREKNHFSVNCENWKWNENNSFTSDSRPFTFKKFTFNNDVI